jgi:hypothetical protein
MRVRTGFTFDDDLLAAARTAKAMRADGDGSPAATVGGATDDGADGFCGLVG